MGEMPPSPADVVAPPGPTGPLDGQTPAAGIEPCPHCGAALALDQRYCLECGAPRTYLSGMLLERLRSPSMDGSPTQPNRPPPLGGVAALGPPSPLSPTWQRGNVLTLIAGIGVLLLAMGVGVLIGRSGGSSSAGSAAPQVISVGGAAGAASTSTTPSAPEETSTAKGGSGSSKQGGKGGGGAGGSSGVGSSPSKSAPSTVLKNLRTGSGQSYEQKSKNLPNVVSTG